MKKTIITIIAAIFCTYTVPGFAQMAELKVMCWNIKAFEGDEKDPSTKYVLENYVNFIKKHNPDILCIQELENQTGRQGSRDLFSALAHQLGMYTHFGFAYIADPATVGLYGNGILSKYPILNTLSEPLPEQRYQSDPRCLQSVEILIPVEGSADGKIIRVINTHFDHNSLVDDMTKSLIRKYFTGKDMPTLFTGDFNHNPWGSWFGIIRPVFDIFDPGYKPGQTSGHTWSHTWATSTKLDWVLGHPMGVWNRTSFMVDYDHKNLSDHYPIIVTLKLNK